MAEERWCQRALNGQGIDHMVPATSCTLPVQQTFIVVIMLGFYKIIKYGFFEEAFKERMTEPANLEHLATD